MMVTSGAAHAHLHDSHLLVVIIPRLFDIASIHHDGDSINGERGLCNVGCKDHSAQPGFAFRDGCLELPRLLLAVQGQRNNIRCHVLAGR